MAAVTREDLDELEERVCTQIAALSATVNAALTQQGRNSEACIKLGFETLQKALQPGTLVLLIVLAALLLGGTSGALAIAQGLWSPGAAQAQQPVVAVEAAP